MTWWRAHKGATITAAVAIVVLAVVAVFALMPSDTDDYRNTAVKTAQDTQSEVRTVSLALQADLAGKTYDPYLSTVLWQARYNVSTSASDLAGEEVPDPTAAAVQKRLSGLLDEAITSIGAADAATGIEDDNARHQAIEGVVHRLDEVGSRLQKFTEATRAELNS
ncbi:hypothetical protein [Labedaea rhizosphaerae]|uniref:Uncharacterized protein n=1 Tax=Labedaea rhizosphaerae TaxID=598644 RepID=A0A4R6S9I6_LABRH|nr:hypothetical protein [Labedaea rhizosphaerae]TDP96461.1 hypothetical protein EV186_104449 [Labedaea rhizosphaerae]